jgi:diguanylate cyclase (GGDEF)-like protein
MEKPTPQRTSSKSAVRANREEEKKKPGPLLESLETSRVDLACGQAEAGIPLERNLAHIEGIINQREPISDSFAGLLEGNLLKFPRYLSLSIGIALVLIVGIFNHIAGPELSSPALYSLPVLLVTWFTERWIGFILSIIGVLTWLIVDLTSGASYSFSDIPYWNGVKRLGSLFILTIIVSMLKSTLTREKEISRIDFLTGIPNRRYFMELVNMEINRVRRYGHPFTVVCIDLDNFKTVNDCFGHSTGDILLRLVARTIQQNVRATDTVARLGGDEFAILLPETGRNVAEVIMQKVQKINLDIMRRHGWPVTLSIGVVTFMSPPSTVDEVLRLSDRLMYIAKDNGKNSIQYEVLAARERPPVPAA